MGKYLGLVIGVTVAFLSGCQMSSDFNSSIMEKHSFGNYELSVPKGFSYAENAPRADYFYFGYSKDHHLQMPSVRIWDSSFEDCTNNRGITNQFEMNLEPVLAQWGKVDYPFDYSATKIEPDCRPYPPVDASYAFCAETDGKAVVICIQQMTDNPELAEEIFRSFRWLE